MNVPLIPHASYSPIGVEITPTTIAAAQWRSARAGRTLVASVRYGRAASTKPGKEDTTSSITSDEIAHLAGVLRRQGFVGGDVVLAAPDERLMVATLELPPRSSGAPLAQIAAAELARMHKADPGALRTQFWEIAAPTRAGASDATHAMVAGLPERDAMDLSRAFESAGLALAAIDARCWGLARVCREMVGPTGEPCAAIILDVGESGTLLVVVRLDGDGAQVVYERSIAGLGLGAIRARLAETTQMDPEIVSLLVRPGGLAGEADLSALLAGEVASVLREYAELFATEVATASSYTAHRYPVPLAGLFVCGAALEAPGLLDAIRARLPLPPESMRVLRPTGLARVGDDHKPAGPCDLRFHDAGLTSACGLALYPMEAAA